MPRPFVSSFGILILAFLPTASCTSSRTSSTEAKIAPTFAAWARSDSPGCGVGVSRDGAVVYERGFGMASLERHVPITTSTVFPLASITKSFTAMSVLLAAERGVLSLEDDVAKYVPEWSVREHKVTIRQLLTHTSGLRDGYTLQGWSPSTEPTNAGIMKILARQRGLNFAPGNEYQYNNGGYLLLGEILKSASGQSLAAFAGAHIFKPLGMTGASFNGEPAASGPDRASSYSPQANGWRLVPNGSSYAGNGGMIASVRDLLQWANNFTSTRVGSPALLTRMHTASVLSGGQTTQHGMGFGIGSYRGARTLRTSGGDFGMATEVVLYPDQKVAIAVLCNMDSVVVGGLATVNPDDLTNAVADVVLEDVLERRPAPGAASTGAASTGPVPTATAAPPATAPPATATASADELASKTGLYRLGPDGDHIALISVRDGKLVLRDYYGDNFDMMLTPIGADRFVLAGITLEFAPAEAGRPRAWHIVDGEGHRVFELQLMEFSESNARLKPFAGSYRSEELDTTYTVTLREPGLVMQMSALQPVAKDAFVGDFVGTVRFLRDRRGAVTGFTLNRDQARGVRFERVRRGV